MRTSIVIPTWNERANICPLLESIDIAMTGTDYEVVVVDDNSPDGTAQAVEEYMLGHRGRRLHLLRRPSKQGLAGAVLEGATIANGDYLVMMDADHSHDPSAIQAMLQKLDQGYDVVVGSRYSGETPSIRGWPLKRQLASRFSITVAQLLLRLKVEDLTSGYAAFRRCYIMALPTRFSAGGFKLLLEVLSVWPDLKVAEHHITFANRASGRSKFGVGEIVAFLRLCLRLWWYRMRHRH